jgi:outer membrane immunogenic protein
MANGNARTALGLLLGAGVLAAAATPAAAQTARLPANWAGGYAMALSGGGWGNIGTPSSTGSGPVLGAAVGYHLQRNAIVFGVEADLMWSRRGVPGTWAVPWTTSLRGRLGFAFGQTMIFVTAGLSVASFNYLGSSSIEVGPIIGGGFQGQLNDRLFLRVEQLYARYGTIGGTSVTAALHETRAGLGIAF